MVSTEPPFVQLTGTCHSQVLCGVGEGQSQVHLMFVYQDPDSEAGYDDKISLSYKLPVLQEEFDQ